MDIILTIPYKGHRAAEHLKFLEPLKEKKLIERIEVINSGVRGEVYIPDVEYLVDGEVMRGLPEAAKENPEGFQKYTSDLLKVFNQKPKSLIIPTSDKGVYAASYCIPQKNRTSPDLEIVNLFQNKADTNKFIFDENIFRTPLSITIPFGNLGSMNLEVTNFIREQGGEIFAKPSCPQSGGSYGVGKIRSFDQLDRLISQSPIKGDYLLSELLFGPEYNHSVIIGCDGKVVAQCTYLTSLCGTSKKKRSVVNSQELEGFGERFAATLYSSFSNYSFRGVYNVDFLFNSKRELVLSEINSGRFPAKLGVFRNSGIGFNPLEKLLLATSR